MLTSTLICWPSLVRSGVYTHVHLLASTGDSPSLPLALTLSRSRPLPACPFPPCCIRVCPYWMTRAPEQCPPFHMSLAFPAGIARSRNVNEDAQEAPSCTLPLPVSIPYPCQCSVGRPSSPEVDEDTRGEPRSPSLYPCRSLCPPRSITQCRRGRPSSARGTRRARSSAPRRGPTPWPAPPCAAPDAPPSPSLFLGGRGRDARGRWQGRMRWGG